MIYLDTSAAMKLVRLEAHSHELSDWLRERRDHTILSSVVIEVELVRATRRAAPEKLFRAAEILRGLATVTLSAAVIARAAAYLDANLRSLDAIHLATAEHLVNRTKEQLDGFIAYDGRLLEAARSAGLPVVAPGAA